MTPIQYHERTKHHLDRYAAHLGYFDWDNQPDPFRTYKGAERFALERTPPHDEPSYDAIFDPTRSHARPVDYRSVSQLFYDSLALSAWKQQGDRKWALRCNPSSGNLHPVEAYLLAPAIAGMTEQPGLFHYAPYIHALEHRASGTEDVPTDAVIVGLTTIYWRESWKYGERAFRYCQLDLGHAIGAVAAAAAVLGWRTFAIDDIDDDAAAALLGIADQTGPEAEHPERLLYLVPHSLPPAPVALRAAGETFAGSPNRLSKNHHDWPIIETVGAAARRTRTAPNRFEREAEPAAFGHDDVPAREILRRRRSAPAFDGKTRIELDTFARMMGAVLPGHCPINALSSPASLHLALFVHRVSDLAPGLYMLVRNPADGERLQTACHRRFAWRRPDGCPDDLPLFLLETGDERETAKTLSGHQDIAADGVFALAMIADFTARLEANGAWDYRRLHWEAGIIGQVLYLEAEAAGIRGTGIGCYFDDAMHDRLGIQGHAFQSLYHFTVGAPVDDPRIQSIPAYAHLEDAVRP